jgi:hypothetical protein
MQVLGKLMHHVRLVMRMARATRTDLVDAHDRGELSQARWAGMVQTCRSCAWSDRCGDWLDRNGTVAMAPKTCLNRHQFAALRAPAQHRNRETV